MDGEIRLRIILEAPPPGVDFGLQKGKGHPYEVIEKARSTGKDLAFNCAVSVKDNRADGLPNFLGPLAQGGAEDRFVYIDVGQYAGQQDTEWSRRIKIPLAGISWALIKSAISSPTKVIETRIPGTGKDGGPSCATVRPKIWKVR